MLGDAAETLRLQPTAAFSRESPLPPLTARMITRVKSQDTWTWEGRKESVYQEEDNIPAGARGLALELDCKKGSVRAGGTWDWLSNFLGGRIYCLGQHPRDGPYSLLGWLLEVWRKGWSDTPKGRWMNGRICSRWGWIGGRTTGFA